MTLIYHFCIVSVKKRKNIFTLLTHEGQVMSQKFHYLEKKVFAYKAYLVISFIAKKKKILAKFIFPLNQLISLQTGTIYLLPR